MKNYAYDDFGNLIAMETSNSGSQSMGNEVLSHSLSPETNAIAETSNPGHLASSHSLSPETKAIAETSNSETNAITETSNALPGDLIGWRDTPITEIDIRSFNPFRFSSEYHDDELNLIYYNYRHYNPATGRFLSRDPIEEQGGTNLYNFLYNFTANNPINVLDIFGLSSCIEGEKLFVSAYSTVIPDDMYKADYFDDLLSSVSDEIAILSKIIDTVTIGKSLLKNGFKKTMQGVLKDKIKNEINVPDPTDLQMYENLINSIAKKSGTKTRAFRGKINTWIGFNVLNYKECVCTGWVFKELDWKNKIEKEEVKFENMIGLDSESDMLVLTQRKMKESLVRMKNKVGMK